MSEFSLGAISAALDGLAARQRVIATNIANAETPGYLAKRVSFEASLRDAIDNRDLTGYRGIDTTQSLAATLPNGNNVQLDQETVDLTETDLKYQLMASAASNEFHIIRASIG